MLRRVEPRAVRWHRAPRQIAPALAEDEQEHDAEHEKWPDDAAAADALLARSAAAVDVDTRAAAEAAATAATAAAAGALQLPRHHRPAAFTAGSSQLRGCSRPFAP